jgi:hypothetical protein
LFSVHLFVILYSETLQLMRLVIFCFAMCSTWVLTPCVSAAQVEGNRIRVSQFLIDSTALLNVDSLNFSGLVQNAHLPGPPGDTVISFPDPQDEIRVLYRVNAPVYDSTQRTLVQFSQTAALSSGASAPFSGQIPATELYGFSGGGGGITVIVVWPRTERTTLPDSNVFVAPNDTATATITIDTLVALPEGLRPTTAGVRVFPNPVQSQVAVLADSPIEHVRLLDATGRTVLVEHHNAVLNLAAFPPGTYTLVVHMRDGTAAACRLVHTP